MLPNSAYNEYSVFAIKYYRQHFITLIAETTENMKIGGQTCRWKNLYCSSGLIKNLFQPAEKWKHFNYEPGTIINLASTVTRLI